jgi:XTP/dITP diphosphohydrolase
MTVSNLYIVTGNKGKLEEAESILGIKLQNKVLEIEEIQSSDIEHIVYKKAEAAFKILQKPLIVDDSGVYFDAWNGFPGPLVKFIDKAGGVDLILKMLKKEKNRNIILKSAIGFHDGNNIYTFSGEIPAKIALEPKGTNGWSWDTIFMPIPFEKTMAEMTSEEKNSLSHRRKALEKFKEFLNTVDRK